MESGITRRRLAAYTVEYHGVCAWYAFRTTWPRRTSSSKILPSQIPVKTGTDGRRYLEYREVEP